MLRAVNVSAMMAVLVCAACASPSGDSPAGVRAGFAGSETPSCTFGCDVRAFESPAPPPPSAYLTGLTLPLAAPAVPKGYAVDDFGLPAPPTAASYVTNVASPLPPPAVPGPYAANGFSIPAPLPAASYVTAPALPLGAPAAFPAFQAGGFGMDAPATAGSYVKDVAASGPAPQVGAPLGTLSCIPGWPGEGNAKACPAPERAPAAVAPIPTRPAPSGLAPARSVPAASAVPPALPPAVSVATPPATPLVATAAGDKAAALPSSNVPLLVTETSNGGTAEIERMFRSVARETMGKSGFLPVRERGRSTYLLNLRFRKSGPLENAGEAAVDWSIVDPRGQIVDTFRQQLMLFPGLYDPKLVPAISNLVEDALARFSQAVHSRG